MKIGGRIRYRRGDIAEYIAGSRFGKGVTPTRPFGQRGDGSGNGRGLNGKQDRKREQKEKQR